MGGILARITIRVALDVAAEPRFVRDGRIVCYANT
jgi:hypothetical protein